MSLPPNDDPAHWPRFCCAILRDAAGRYLLERRSDDDEHMPGQLVCFGGGRNPDEHPDDSIRRELREEIGCELTALEFCLILRGRDSRTIAWFYRAPAPAPTRVRTEPGVRAVWAAWHELGALPIGNWNLAAMIAEREGRSEALVDG